MSENDGCALYLFFIFVLCLFVYLTYLENEENPCVEWSDEAEIKCSGVGDSFDCYNYYPCIRRENDKNTKPPKEAYDRIDTIEKERINYDSFYNYMLQEQKRIDSLFDLIEKAERRKK